MNYMKNKIGIYGYCFIIFMVLSSPFLGVGIYNLLKYSNQDSIIAIFISYIISLALIVVFIKINNFKPDLNLKEKIDILFKKPKLIIFLLACSFFIMLSSLFYNINSFIISQFLSETPIIYIAVLMSILIIYLNSKGLKIITRVSTILFFISVLLIAIAIAGKYDKFDFSNILPLLKDGFKNSLIGSKYMILLNLTYIYTLLIIPKNMINKNKKLTKMLIITISLSFLVFLLITLYTIAILGIDLSVLYHYPAYMVMKELSIFSFVDKIENFIIIHWIFEVFINLNITIYFIHKLTNIKVYIITISSVVFYTILFKNSTFFNYFVSKYIPIFSLIILIIIFLIYIKIKTPKRFIK